MRFTKLHQWVDQVQPGIFKIGLSTFAIKELGEVVYIDFLKNCGEAVKSEEPLAEVESLKSVNYFQLPFDAKIKEVNLQLQDDCTLVNKDPQNSGWLFVLEASEDIDKDLMDEETYRQFAVST